MPTTYGGDNITFPDGSTQNTSPQTGFVNRIINGDMRIDQRNAGASVTVAAGGGVYTLDRWLLVRSTAGSYAVQQSTTAPSGFIASLGITNNTAGTPAAGDFNFFSQIIEGLNISDLGWGTASAQAITLSFQVRASAAGTYSGCLRNAAGNRSYPFTFTVAAANTFEFKSITILGDTTGTWATNNGIGISVSFDLGSGATFRGTAGAWASGNFVGATSASQNMTLTSGATFYITGVSLVKGSTALPWEFRSYGQELALCQRYYQNGPDLVIGGFGKINSSCLAITYLPVIMRAAPTLTYGGSAGTWTGPNAFTGGSNGPNPGANKINYAFGTDSNGSAVLSGVRISAEL